ncbi:MAG: hypothetical protein FJ027_04895 [Candidatus Rokubacteria bacterium]|nr:hypothetical protein [Candidatus Rokubacteria bacterium]
MRQPSDRATAAGVVAPASSPLRELVRRLAVVGLLLAGLTVLATIALA